MKKLRVLIVDDQVRSRQSLKALLRALHTIEEVREATNGFEAIKLVEELQPDIILMDAQMPKMNGIEATHLIKTRWQQVKVIILSIDPDLKVEALAAGADGFISKGEPPEKIKEILAWAEVISRK
jgi:DNA-binding NarL/FixJ family response regulator